MRLFESLWERQRTAVSELRRAISGERRPNLAMWTCAVCHFHAPRSSDEARELLRDWRLLLAGDDPRIGKQSSGSGSAGVCVPISPAMAEEEAEEKVSALTLPGRRLGSSVVAILTLALVASLATGTPAKLPGVALGSAVILHAERTVALFAAVLLLLVVLVRAFQGQLPQELSGRGVKYAERQTTEEIRDAVAVALEEHQTAQQELHARVEALEEMPEDEAEGDVPQGGEEG